MEEETVQTTPKIEKWVIPFGTSLDNVNTILKAFYAAGADAKFVSYDEVIQRGANRNAVVNNLPFLVYLKALTRNEQDSKQYKFTDLGLKYSKAAYAGNKEEMAATLKGLFESSFKELIDFINIKKEKLSFNDIFNQIKSIARIKEDSKYPWGVNPAFRTGINTLIDMLVLAGFVDESLKPPKEAPTKVGSRVARRKPEPQPEVDQGLGKSPQTLPTFQIGTQMNVQVIVDTKDKTSVENYLKMMKRLKKLNAGEEISGTLD